MTLIKWAPKPMNMYDEFDSIFNSFYNSDFRNSLKYDSSWKPDIDIKESNKGFLLKADIAGLSKKDIKINVHGNKLTISGERKDESNNNDYYLFRERSVGKFSRTFHLPDLVNTDKINARCKNGILSIELEKHEEIIPKTKEIVIN